MQRSVPSGPQTRRRAKTSIPADEQAKPRRDRTSSDRQQAVMRVADEQGLLGGQRDGRITGRVPQTLIEAAKKKTALSSDTELITYALANVAIEDNFGETLLALKGAIPETVELEF